MFKKAKKNKIAVVPRGTIPSNSAHSINTLKHAHGFYKLNYNVEVLTLRTLLLRIPNKKIKSIHQYYGISKNIKIKFFNDFSLQNLRNIKVLQHLALKLIPNFKNPLKIKEGDLKLNNNERNNFALLKNLFPFFINSFLILTGLFNPYKKLCKYCKMNDIELVYCRPYEAANYCIKNQIPTIVETHWPNINNPEFRRFAKLSKNSFFKGIVTIHPRIERKLIAAGIPAEKILILDDAVDLEKYSISLDKTKLREELHLPLNKKIIEYTGGLMEGRGIDTILEAANLLRDNELSFYIIGGSEKEIEKWKEFAKKKEIHADINFLGFIENQKIPQFHKAADVLLAPYSIRCTTVDWMSPIKIFEYMASKVPIIASDVVRMKEICNNNECLFFKADDAQDLSNKISLLNKDKNLQEKLVQNAYDKSKEHTYNIRCTKILNKFKD